MGVLHAIGLGAGWTHEGNTHTRRFQWPKPLPPGEELWLALTTDAPAVVRLNGVEIGSSGGGEWAARLAGVGLRNEVVVETAGEVSAARLEVRDGG